MSSIKPIDQFQYKELTPLPTNKDPDYEHLSLLQKEVNANTRSIDSNGGSGTHGMLVISVGEKKYQQLTDTEFIKPAKPSTNPSYPPFASTATVTGIKAEHEAAVTKWENYNNTVKAIRAQMLKAIPRDMIADLADEETEFSEVTPYQIFEYLWENYGVISSDMLTDNLNKLHEDWDHTSPISTLWTRIKKVQEFATKGKEPIAKAVVIRAVLKILEDTRLFKLDIRDWHRTKPKKMTLANLQAHFTKANKERLREGTAASAGFSSTPEGQALAATATEKTEVKSTTALMYCWTHGLNDSHPGKRTATNKGCERKGQGHKEAATIDNMMGGNNVIQRRRGEKRIHIPPEWNNSRNNKWQRKGDEEKKADEEKKEE